SMLAQKRAGNQRLPELTAYGTGVSVNQRAQEEVTVGVRLTVSLPNVDAFASYKNAVVDSTSKEIQLRQLREAIHEEVLTTVNQLTQSYQRIRSAKLAAKLSQQKLNAEIVKFQIGQLPQKNVVDSQRDVAAARLQELEAYVAYRKALIRLDSAVGVVKYR
ncbi:MAG: TolC family protein, partial [Bdellovibrionia bacterium]